MDPAGNYIAPEFHPGPSASAPAGLAATVESFQASLQSAVDAELAKVQESYQDLMQGAGTTAPNFPR